MSDFLKLPPRKQFDELVNQFMADIHNDTNGKDMEIPELISEIIKRIRKFKITADIFAVLCVRLGVLYVEVERMMKEKAEQQVEEMLNEMDSEIFEGGPDLVNELATRLHNSKQEEDVN